MRNFDTPGIVSVTVTGNRVYAWQKGGIVINGDVSATVQNNIIGASATQANLAANGLQVAYGALASLSDNTIEGNTWLGYDPVTSDWAATAILLYEAAPGTKVENNIINLIAGNADVGLYVNADMVVVAKNRIYDFGPDVDGPDMDIGIANVGLLSGGVNNTFKQNKVRCFQQAFDNVTGPGNVILPCTDPTSTAAPEMAAASLLSRPASPYVR